MNTYVQRCGVIDREIRIGIPGNKIPSWFKEEEAGYKMTLKIPSKCNTKIIGIMICGVFRGEWQGPHYGPNITVGFKRDGESVSRKLEVGCSNAFDGENNGNVWFSYKPLGFFYGVQREDWSGLKISICGSRGEKGVRCATRLIYKQDMEFMDPTN